MISVTMQFENIAEVAKFFGFQPLAEQTREQEKAQTTVDTVFETALETAVAAAPVNTLSKFDTLMSLLNDPKWEYRKVSTLAETVGIGEGEVYGLLDDHDIDYCTLTQRGTGATLIRIVK